MSRLIDPVSKKPITPDNYPTLDGYNEFHGVNEFVGEADFEGPSQFDGQMNINSDVKFATNNDGALIYVGGFVNFIDLANGDTIRKNPQSGEIQAYPMLGYITHNTTNNVQFTIAADQRASEFIYNDSPTTIPSLTIGLPDDFVPGQICRYFTHGACTAVSVEGPTVLGAAVTALAADSTVAWISIDVGGSFVRIQ